LHEHTTMIFYKEISYVVFKEEKES